MDSEKKNKKIEVSFQTGDTPTLVCLQDSTDYIVQFWYRSLIYGDSYKHIVARPCPKDLTLIIHSYYMIDLIVPSFPSDDHKHSNSKKLRAYTVQKNIRLKFGKVFVGKKRCLTITHDPKYQDTFQALIIECDEMVIEGKIDMTGFGFVDSMYKTEEMNEIRHDYFDCPSVGLKGCWNECGGGIIHLIIHKHFENKGEIVAAGVNGCASSGMGGDGGHVLIQTRSRDFIKKHGKINISGGRAICDEDRGSPGIIHIETKFDFTKPTKYLTMEAI